MSGFTRRRALIASLGAAAAGTVGGFDPAHGAWTALLKRHVRVQRDGVSTRVHYAGMAADRAELGRYRAQLSAVKAAEFASWPKPERQAFLLNAYNANTVELVLGRYPGLASIRDLGTLLHSPWKPRWIALLGRQVSLDDIEHAMLRERGVYDDPRVHFAANCASIGCPALRDEAYVAASLEAQLDDQARRFMSDRQRNRWNPQRERLELSKIFDWYAEDFRLGHRGIGSLWTFAARYADVLADDAAVRERIRAGHTPITFLDYDWALNDAR